MEMNIKYIAVGRSTDNSLLAVINPDKLVQNTASKEIANIVPQVTDTDWRQKFASEMGTWHIESSGNKIIYCVLTRVDYPDYHCSQLLKEL